MRILILGGSGFLGSHVVDRFLGDAHNVCVYDLCTERFRRCPAGVEYYAGDLGNVGALEEVISTGFDAVLHFISTTTPKSSNSSPKFDIQSNLVGTVDLLDICVKHKVKKFVFLSSGGTVYGNIGAEGTVDESHATQPICSYGATKLAIEQHLYVQQHLHGLKFVSLRISNPYGERQNPLLALGAATVFLHRMMTQQPIDVWGDGSVVRDFIYAGDVANAVYLATTENVTGIFNVGSGVGISLRQLIDEISVILNVTPQVRWLESRPYDVPRIVLNSSKLKAAAGWNCSRSLREGIARTASWLRTVREFEPAKTQVQASVTTLDQRADRRKRLS
jgi:UDP-glucose 4-epimerase